MNESRKVECGLCGRNSFPDDVSHKPVITIAVLGIAAFWGALTAGFIWIVTHV
jgi:hypothetical protein